MTLPSRSSALGAFTGLVHMIKLSEKVDAFQAGGEQLGGRGGDVGDGRRLAEH